MRWRAACLLVLGAALLTGCDGSGAATKERRANVILIVSDDQANGTEERMPFLSGLNDATDFTAYYDNNPLCCPTRTTLLTGLYSHHTGIVNNEVAQRFDDSSTLATWLDGNGYETALIGKYLNLYPWNRGDYVPPGWDRWLAFAGGSEGYYDYTLTNGKRRRDYGNRPADYSTTVLASQATKFVESSEAPFFLYFSPYGPHSPRTPGPGDERAFRNARVDLPPNFNRAAAGSPRYWKKLPSVSRAEARDQTRAQWATLQSVDDSVRSLFGALERAGELENTVVIYLSDNGYALGSHRNTQKDCPYEECIHLPLTISLPGQGSPASIDALVSSIDIAPTIAELTGTPIPGPVDGTSLVPLLNGEAESLDRPVLLQHAFYEGTAPSFWGIRTEDWMYARYRTGEVELYDLSQDPYELKNLAGDPRFREQQEALAAELAGLRR